MFCQRPRRFVVKHLSGFIRSATFANIWIMHSLNVSSIPLFHLISTATTLSYMDFHTIFCHLYREFKILPLVSLLVQNAMNPSHLFYMIFTGWLSRTEFISKYYFWLIKLFMDMRLLTSAILFSFTTLKSLCSASQLALKPGSHSKTSSYGDRAFAVAAPKLWNNIPFNICSAASIGQFKTQLKTFLFN